MIRGNHAATWHQRPGLSSLLHVLGPAFAAAAVTATTHNPAEYAWVFVVTGLICWAARLDNYPIHLMSTARFAVRVGSAMAAAAVAVAPAYLEAVSLEPRAVATVVAAGVGAAVIAMVDALFTMTAVRIAVIGEASFAELLAHQFADSGVRGFVFATCCSPSTPVDAFEALIRDERIDLVVIENRVLASPRSSGRSICAWSSGCASPTASPCTSASSGTSRSP